MQWALAVLLAFLSPGECAAYREAHGFCFVFFFCKERHTKKCLIIFCVVPIAASHLPTWKGERSQSPGRLGHLLKSLVIFLEQVPYTSAGTCTRRGRPHSVFCTMNPTTPGLCWNQESLQESMTLEAQGAIGI